MCVCVPKVPVGVHGICTVYAVEIKVAGQRRKYVRTTDSLAWNGSHSGKADAECKYLLGVRIVAEYKKINVLFRSQI